jgi:DNA-binding XRE family transcriptional regulator
VKEFRVLVKVRNNRLIQRREELGLSAPRLAEKMGVNYHSYVQLESMKDSPLDSAGEWRAIAVTIAEFHAVSLDELFPEAVQQIRQASAMRLMDGGELAALASGEFRQTEALMPDEIVARKQLVESTREALDKLSPRKAKAMKLRFGFNGNEPATIRTVGNQLGGICVERSRQIIEDGLRRLRHPSISKQLRDVK